MITDEIIDSVKRDGAVKVITIGTLNEAKLFALVAAKEMNWYCYVQRKSKKENIVRIFDTFKRASDAANGTADHLIITPDKLDRMSKPIH